MTVNTGAKTAWLASESDGIYVFVSAVGTAVPALAQYGGIAGFFASITLLGPDPANWTTHVTG